MAVGDFLEALSVGFEDESARFEGCEVGEGGSSIDGRSAVSESVAPFCLAVLLLVSFERPFADLDMPFVCALLRAACCACCFRYCLRSCAFLLASTCDGDLSAKSHDL